MDQLVVRRPDGRVLQVVVTGPADGPVLLAHHGTPGSSHQPAFLRVAAHARGWRLATVSRPGCPGSTRLPGRTVADVAPDSAAVLDALGVDRAWVCGASGGGPHALACGALLPDRVRSVAVVAGVGPYDAPDLDLLAGMGQDNLDEFTAALAGEAALRAWLEEQRPGLLSADAAQVVASLQTLLPPVDVAVMTGDLGDDLARSLQDAVSAGVDGWLDDDLAFLAPWGFDLDAITVPVSVWQGGADLMVPAAHGAWLAAHVPGVRAHLEPDEGHLSLGIGAVDRILDELADTGD